MLLDLRSIIKLLDKSSELCISLFRECRPGFLMEDYFHHDLELRVATIFGKVIVGASDNGLKIHSLDSGPSWVK